MNTKINSGAIEAGSISADKLGSDVPATLKTDMGLSTVATSGSYNDLTNKPTIPAAVTESTVSGWGFTKNTGTITGIKMNGASKGTSGVVDLGTVITSHQDISGKQDQLVSGTNIKTVNGTSILGSGNVLAGVKPLVTFNATSIAMDPNKYYRLTTAKTSLTITLNTPSDSTILNEYFIEFPCTSTMTLTVPSTVKWANASVPTFESGKTYQISIVNNLAVCANFS